MFLSDGRTPLLLSANDVIYIGKATAGRVRRRIQQQTGIPAAHIMITATHTHSGPLTVDVLSNEGDAAVPKTDPAYLQRLEDGIVEAAVRAYQAARPARLGLAVADGTCVGTNRHDPLGPSNHQVPLLVARDRQGGQYLALLAVCSMHPTVLHEDSRLISGDFPAACRRFLQEELLGGDCPVIYCTGPCGNQSPRHVTRGNTFAEADRLGRLLGASIAGAAASAEEVQDARLACAASLVELSPRKMPSAAEAARALQAAQARLEELRRGGASRAEVRTAECDWFGAQEGLTLARAAAAGRLDAALASIMPAEITAMRIGPWRFVAWPGESYVEFSLAVRARWPNCHLIHYANGELQGYLVTEEAVHQGHYESLNALLASPQAGNRLVQATLELLEQGGVR